MTEVSAVWKIQRSRKIESEEQIWILLSSHSLSVCLSLSVVRPKFETVIEENCLIVVVSVVTIDSACGSWVTPTLSRRDRHSFLGVPRVLVFLRCQSWMEELKESHSSGEGTGPTDGGGGGGGGAMQGGGNGGGGAGRSAPGGGPNNGASSASGLHYSIPGILHFLQHEWSRFEMERSQWEVEKAELQVRSA